MEIAFYTKKNGACPVEEFIDKLQSRDRAKVLACLRNVEELGFESPRVEFRQIRGRLWEIKIKTADAGVRIFYVSIGKDNIMLLHAYKKESQKAPTREIKVAEQRMQEVIHYEKSYA